MAEAVWDTPDDVDDAEFGGPERRRERERKLVWKIDKRMSILVLIYILNIVGFTTVSAYVTLFLNLAAGTSRTD